MMKLIYQFCIVLFLSVCGLTALSAKEGDQYLLTEKNWKSLTKINELIQSGEANEAILKLNDLLPTVKKAYDTAVTQQTLGHAYSAISDYPNAISAFRIALSSNALPFDVNHDLNINLAQLLIFTKKYQEGISYFDQWIKSEANPSLNDYILAGTAHYELKQYSSAIPYAKNIITLKPSYDENWHLLLLQCYLKTANYQNAAQLLEKMLRVQPENKIYWQQLIATWQQAKDDQKTLATMELMHTKGLFSPEETKQLINMYLYLQMPNKAGNLLSAQIVSGRLPKNPENVELLGNCWQQAKEWLKSAESLNWAAQQTGNSDLFYRVGQIYFELEKYPLAIEQLQIAISKGKLSQPNNAQLLLGIALFHEENYQASIKALELALHSKPTKPQAEWWLQRINDLKL